MSNVKSVIVDNKTQKITNVSLENGDSFTFSEFIETFKNKLQTIVAGEVITWDDYWRYQKQISPKAMETHLEVVEAEAQVSNLKLPKLSKGQALAIGTVVLLFFVALIGIAFAKSLGLF